MKPTKLKNKEGFTLIETLVVIAITAILSSVLLVYNRSNESQIVLYRDQAVIAGLLSRAKSLAIQKYREPALPDYSACAFGVHFEAPRDLILFQDLGLGGCATGRVYAYDSGEELQRLSLDSRLQFLNIPPGGLDIFFVPPELIVGTTATSGLPVSITLQTTNGRFTAYTTVSAGGQITDTYQ